MDTKPNKMIAVEDDMKTCAKCGRCVTDPVSTKPKQETILVHKRNKKGFGYWEDTSKQEKTKMKAGVTEVRKSTDRGRYPTPAHKKPKQEKSFDSAQDKWEKEFDWKFTVRSLNIVTGKFEPLVMLEIGPKTIKAFIRHQIDIARKEGYEEGRQSVLKFANRVNVYINEKGELKKVVRQSKLKAK